MNGPNIDYKEIYDVLHDLLVQSEYMQRVMLQQGPLGNGSVRTMSIANAISKAAIMAEKMEAAKLDRPTASVSYTKVVLSPGLERGLAWLRLGANHQNKSEYCTRDRPPEDVIASEVETLREDAQRFLDEADQLRFKVAKLENQLTTESSTPKKVPNGRGCAGS